MEPRYHHGLHTAEPARARPLPPPARWGQGEIASVVREHSAFVWRTLRFLGVREADLEDACQEVFIVVCRKLVGFEERSSLRTWLRGICVKKAAAYRRSAYVRHEVPVESPDPERCAPDCPEREIESREQLAALDRALDMLDQDKRAVFVLYEIEELAMKEVAAIVGCPLQTAYSRYHVARERVASFVKREAIDHESTGPSRQRVEAMLLGILQQLPSGATGEGAAGSEMAGLDLGTLAPAPAASGLGAAGLFAGALSIAAVVAAVGLGSFGTPEPASPPATTEASPSPAARATSDAVEASPPPLPAVTAKRATPIRLSDLPDVEPVEVDPSSSAPAAPPETDLLDRAQRALASDPASALRHCNEHLSAHPGGAFAQEREVIAIDALVRLGRLGEARARAAQFKAAYPSSGHVRRIDVLIAD